jgi:hypothetical protein
VVDEIAAEQATMARSQAFMLRDCGFGCIIQCPVQENGKWQKHAPKRAGIFSRTHRGEGKTVRLMLAEKCATLSPWFGRADKVRPCIFPLPLRLSFDTMARNGEPTPAQGFVDTCRSRMQCEPF